MVSYNGCYKIDIYDIDSWKGAIKMKKTVIISAMALTLVALPAVGAYAEIVDTVNVTVSPSCTFAREGYASGGVTNNPSHKNGADGHWSTTAGDNTVTATRNGGTATTSLGTSQFKVVCNNAAGYRVTVATEDLVNGTYSIPANTTYSTSVSGWSPIVGSTKIANGGTVKQETSTTAGSVFEVGYGVGLSPVQAAGTYTNDAAATYTLTQL